MKKDLEIELANLIRKYSAHLSAGEITECVIGFITCCVCSASNRFGEIETVSEDLKNIIQNNVDKSKKFFSKKEE